MVFNINNISNPAKVRANFRKYKGKDDATLELSERPDKKYKITFAGRTVHIGSTMADFTKHGDEARRASYLARANAIEGDWRKNKYSKNNLAIHLLWQ